MRIIILSLMVLISGYTGVSYLLLSHMYSNAQEKVSKSSPKKPAKNQSVLKEEELYAAKALKKEKS